MPQAFISSTVTNPALQVTIEPAADPGREVIRILVIGSAHGCDRIVHELYRLGFAEVREWSKPQPTGRINEIMRVLTATCWWNRWLRREKPGFWPLTFGKRQKLGEKPGFWWT